MAVFIISSAFSDENLPSGWYSGDNSYGVFDVNSASSLAANIFTVAGLPAETFFRAMGEAASRVERPIDLVDLDEKTIFTEYLRKKGKLHRVA